ncbi:hypothetical protein ACWCSD_30550 [Nonomuraea sp. NPDC001684]
MPNATAWSCSASGTNPAVGPVSSGSGQNCSSVLPTGRGLAGSGESAAFSDSSSRGACPAASTSSPSCWPASPAAAAG